MPSLLEILDDPNYVNANAATKAAIFDKWAPKDDNYTSANEATKAAIRERFGVAEAIAEAPEKKAEPESGATAAFKSSLERMQADYYAAKAAMGVEGAEAEAKKHRDRAAEIYKQPEFLEHPLDYLAGLAGQSAPYMLAPIAAGAAATVGAPILGAGALGTALAATGATFATSALQFSGSNLSRQLEEGASAKDLKVLNAVAASS